MKMSDQELRQPATLSLLNDMINNATNAFSGLVDPATGQMRQGVTWIHDQIEALATLQVQRITARGPAPQLVPNNNIRRATVQLHSPTVNEVTTSTLSMQSTNEAVASTATQSGALSGSTYGQAVGKEVHGGNA
jgi:hypothetical protein